MSSKSTTTKLIHDIQPDNMWGFGKSMAILNYMTTGLVYEKKIPVTYIDTDEEEIEVEVYHECDLRDYPEVCGDCWDRHLDNVAQMQEDNYRDSL